MDQKPITIIVSDLHLGGGKTDLGDDHVYQEAQFCDFLANEIPESKKGKVELFINGDFLEFAQVSPEVYTLGSAKYWCSENESLRKIETIINGHRDIFKALNDFTKRGNDLTVAAGNHDVDLWWNAVQKRLRREVNKIEFALGKTWFFRYNNRLMIGHGHMFDSANKFKNWKKPILQLPNGIQRLEMCPGTLFMVKFLNQMENKYPFIDNVKPISALARILYREDPYRFKMALWLLMRLAGEHPVSFLGFDETTSNSFQNIGEQILSEIQLNKSFAKKINGLYKDIESQGINLDVVPENLSTTEDIFEFLLELFVKVDSQRWMPVFDMSIPVALGTDSSGETLSILQAGIANEKETLKQECIGFLSTFGAEVIVCGHTHQPDEWRNVNGKGGGGYFNPGSWTRYVDIGKMPNLTLEDLKREEDFPYELNYIRVEASIDGHLHASKICYKSEDAKWS